VSSRGNSEHKSWFNNFVKEFRRRYYDLPENTRKFVWNIDDFNPPCQLISIVLAVQELSFLWVRRDNELPDMDLRCYGPINPNEFVQTSEEILSDKDLYKPFKDEEVRNWNEQSFGSFLEKQLVWVSRMVQNMSLTKVTIPPNRVIGTKLTIPQNGFFWMVYGDITKVDVELIFKEIFEGAYLREKAQENQIGKISVTQPSKEEIISGYGTYFYPPSWIGDLPIFDFRAKVNGILILQPPTIKIEYKNSMLVFNQRGLFFVGVNDRQKCIRYMNEIIGVAILQGYNLDIITDLDIGEAIVTEEKGEIRWLTSPKSIIRNWQFQQWAAPITEDMIASYTQIGEKDLLNVVKIAESTSINAEISDNLIFFAHASNYFRDGKYKESFLFDWFIIERYLMNIWDLHIGLDRLKDNKSNKKVYWNINNVIKVLYLTDKIDKKMYDVISSLKATRNSLYHKGAEVSKEVAIRCHKISELLIRNETNIIAPGEK
jgi:hypothetical protein